MPHFDLEKLSVEMRKIILKQAYAAHTGHIGCGLSIVNMLTALYFSELKGRSADDPNRDRFILSKGHAAMALHAALFLKGWISKRELLSFHTNGTYLGVHPEYGLSGVELATGSLGQGLSVGAGIALAARMKRKRFRTFVLLSDAECNEGSTWEAIAFAAHHRLDNLTVLVDLNGQQGFGYTKDILDLSPMREKWKAFGWNVKEVKDDVKAIRKVIRSNTRFTKPTVVLVHTTLGKGVGFMQRKVDWHYLPLTKELYEQALRNIEKLQ